MSLSDREKIIRQKLRDDFIHYAIRCLNIRAKSGKISSFSLNTAQRYIHKRLEDQKRNTGKVRALVLKGRQQGCSTYIGGRFYHAVSHRKGTRVFILTHEQAATDNLFEMVTRYHNHCPDIVKPHTAASNAKELFFDRLDSGYKVGTAGTKGVGRSSTVQLFHGSEVAFWPNADSHAAGVIQAVPDEEGTEIILESTANGIGNYFHAQWQKAEAGQSEYIAVFVPWYWQEEYTTSVPEGFTLSSEESEYKEVYGLTDGQIAWRRSKVADLGEALFKQEYPATAAEAFLVTGEDTFILPEIVLPARKAKISEVYGPRLLGVDPARYGDDRTALCLRQGRKVYYLEGREKRDTMETAGEVAMLIRRDFVDQVFVDVVGIGAGVYDRLVELGYGDKVTAVNGGSSPIDKNKYINKRAEMWAVMKQWLVDQPAEIPDDDALHADLIGVHYAFDSNSRLKLERKEDMKKRGVRSPDLADALALTFAFPVGGTWEDHDIDDFETSDGRNSVGGY